MRRLPFSLLLLVPLVLLPAAGPPARPIPSPLSPRAALPYFDLDAGLRIELVASEPQIESPVAIQFDPDGRLLVVEMLDYPNGPAPGKPPQGRIKILEDRDGDGHYEHARVFADKLLFANGLLPWKGGLVVTAAPAILYLEDTDGDGKADRREILYEGFAAQNPQLRVSHPVLGLDGWIHVANGLRGGKVVRHGQKGALPIDLAGRDFRFDLLRDRGEAISGMGQFGNTFDDWGQRFVCDNRHHLRHIVLPDRYLRRNPLLAVAAVVQDTSELAMGEAGSGTPIFPLSKNWTTSNLHAGRFTAACGVHIYLGSLLPQKYHGSAFTCDPTGNLVHQEILTPSGATFRSRAATAKREFLATPDDWCRPVSLAHGPDGALYVVDTYRAVIEHPEFMPKELKTRPDLLLGKDRGRIWRIVPRDHRTRAIRPGLGKATTARLVDLLAHPDVWWRTTAHRLLLEREDREAIPPLKKLCSSKEPRARVRAAWLLERLGALDVGLIEKLLGDEHPRVREQAVLLAEGLLTKNRTLQDRLTRMSEDRDARVRFQVALSLGEWDDESIVPALARIALRGADDRWTRAAVASAVPTRAGKLLGTLLGVKDGLTETLSPDRIVLLQELAALVGARQDRAETTAFLAILTAVRGGNADRWHRAGLVGLTEGLARRGQRLGTFLKGIGASDRATVGAVETLLGDCARVARDAKRELPERLEAIRLLAHAPQEIAEPVLSGLLENDPIPDVRRAAVRGLASFPSPEVPKRLLAVWSSATPTVRQEVIGVLLQQPSRVRVLLDELQAGRIKPRELDALSMRRLMNQGPADLRERARKLLASAVPEGRQKVLARYKAALDQKGEARRGKEVFRTNCASCHHVAGIGTRIGPDISDTRTKTAAMLMTDILDPNAAIDANYLAYQVTTKRGKILTGLLVAETASSLTLKQQDNQVETLLRQDVEEIRSLGQSLMPEGLEKTISVAQMADLLAFLKNWRYLDGAVPVVE